MLKSLYERFCAGTLALCVVEGGERHSLLLTPKFNDVGLLAGVEVELTKPEPVEETPAPAPQAAAPASQPQNDAGGTGQSQQQAQGEQLGGTGNVELDPVTGQPKAKASEQV